MTSNQNTTPRRGARKWLRDWRFWTAAAVALYTLLGFLVVPLIAKHELPKQVRAQLGCEASVGAIRFNPYTFNTRVRDLKISDRKGEPLASVAELFVNFAPWPLVKKQIVVEEVRATAPALVVRLREDGAVNLLDLVPVRPPASSGKDTSQEMLVRVDRVRVTGGSVEYHDATTDPDASAAVDSIALTARSYRSAPGDTAQFELSFAQRGGKGRAHAKGWVMPQDGIVDARIDADSLSLVPVDPYLGRYAYLDIQSGKLAVHGYAHVVAAPDSLPAIDYRGDIVSDDLHIRDNLKDQDFFGYKRLSILKAEAKSNPPSARVDEIGLDHIYARIAIAADRSFNVTDVFAPAIALADSLERTKAAVSASASDSSHTVTVSVKGAGKAGAKPEAPLPDIAIGRIKIDGGEVDFSDLSLPLPFATRVHDVKGEVTALSPDNAAGSRVEIVGTVDQSGFAKATGYINAFDPVAFTDISVSFRNVELTSMTPYSGKFMGYRIKRGKLSLGLEYDIKQAQLKASNQILLEKLSLGEKVESKDAVGLPIKLAIALLKDKNGNIDLDLDVHGDLNDPKVNTASLIWQALKKVIVKITTAPFRFLGNLVGIGGDEMEFVEFEGGQSRLTPPQHERLGNLAKALTERPQLKLEVRGTFDRQIDPAAIRSRRFEDLVVGRLLASTNGDSAVARVIARDPSSGHMQAVLEQLVVESLGADVLAAMKTANTRVPEAGGEAQLDVASYLQAMRDRLTAAQKVDDSELTRLSAERAGVIRSYLVDAQKIPAERIEIIEPDVTDEKGDWVRCRLSLAGAD